MTRFPFIYRRHRVAVQLGLALSVIVSLAVIVMAGSVFVAQTTEGYAAAINQAGTLRMQSYRIASALIHNTPFDSPHARKRSRELIEEFHQRLTSPRIQHLLEQGLAIEVEQAYENVARQWYEELSPKLQIYLELIEKVDRSPEEDGALNSLHRLYLDRVDMFVDAIHQFVFELEIEAEEKIRTLRLVQGAALLLTLLLAVITLRLLKKKVFKPLKELDACARAAARGDFTRRSNYIDNNELGQLSTTFNTMAEELSRIYADLERRVEEQTADIARSHRSIELLYEVTRRLSHQAVNEQNMESLLHTLCKQFGVEAATLCLGHGQGDDALLYATTRNGNVTGGTGSCSTCFAGGVSTVLQCTGESTLKTFSTPVCDQQQQYGVLLIDYLPEQVTEERQFKLIETIANHIATAFNMAQQASRARRLALLDERSVIARELHDSLAQSLSYLKIQVSRLEKLSHDDNAASKAEVVIDNLRDGLTSAYRQLRELLTTFRLQMDEGGLHGALEKTVEEFAERGDLEIELDDHLKGITLSPNAEIHIIQIVREALSNIIKHAHATQVAVRLELERDGNASLHVQDNGIGIGDITPKPSHYGTTIMLERAKSLDGTLQMRPAPEGGTEVVLHFNLHRLDQREQESSS